MEPSNRSLTTSGITRSYLLFFLLLLLSNLLYGYNYINAYLSDRQGMLANVATKLQKRIEAYRYITYQVYENLSADDRPTSTTPYLNATGETRLRPDIYLLEKVRTKTDALIFGTHDAGTRDLALRVSNYLDTLWGPTADTYSLYYLNGQDNSLIMVSTLSIKELSARNKEGYLSNAVDSRKAEMLQQANALDEREGFSDLRKSRYLNSYYFTLRTTFNNPGHLATVIAFDLPADDILPGNLPAYRFQLIAEQGAGYEAGNAEEQPSGYSVLKWPWLTVSAPLNNAALKIQFHVPVTALIVDIMRNNFWLLLINLALLGLSLIGFYFIRHQYIRPGKRMAAQLSTLQQMNQEIITHLPLGLLVYRFDNDSVITSNKMADHLLPHLSMTKIASIADEHQGQVQVTVNNEVYEIQMVRDPVRAGSALFLIRDLGKEILVSKKLQQAQREFERNLRARKVMTDNLSQELNAPLTHLRQLAETLQAGELSPLERNTLWREAFHAHRIINEVILLTRLESNDWAPEEEIFQPGQRLESILKDILPEIRRKGLTLLVQDTLEPELRLNGDITTLEQILLMLLHYAVTTTAYGKIRLHVSHSVTQAGLFQFELSDTGGGVSEQEIAGLNYPWQTQAQSDRFSRGSGLTYYLCNQLCKKLGGQLEIHSKRDIGTRYQFSASFQIEARPQEEHERLLEGITVRLQLISEEVRTLIARKMSAFGASTTVADERDADEEYDILLTDDPTHAEDFSLLLVSDSEGYEEYAPHRMRANFNLTESLIDAILLLIEQQISAGANKKGEESADSGLIPKNSPFKSEDYYSLFAETVPVDVKNLYTEAEHRDYASLSLTAHRLKGVFAMLDIPAGKSLCEQLEQAIKEGNTAAIETLIGQIDNFVSILLQLGSQ